MDARKGGSSRRRHSFIANLLRIQHVVVAVKMDLVDYSQRSTSDREGLRAPPSRLDNIVDITPIPISALNERQRRGQVHEHAVVPRPLAALSHLEHVYVGGEENRVDARFRCSG